MDGGLGPSVMVIAGMSFASFAIHAVFIALGGFLVRQAVKGQGAFRFFRETTMLFAL